MPTLQLVYSWFVLFGPCLLYSPCRHYSSVPLLLLSLFSSCKDCKDGRFSPINRWLRSHLRSSLILKPNSQRYCLVLWVCNICNFLVSSTTKSFESLCHNCKFVTDFHSIESLFSLLSVSTAYLAGFTIFSLVLLSFYILVFITCYYFLSLCTCASDHLVSEP